MAKKRIKLSDEIRQAVRNFVAMSRNGICGELGIDKGLFSRFMAGTAGLSVGNLDALAAPLIGVKGCNVETDKRHERRGFTDDEMAVLLDFTRQTPTRWNMTAKARDGHTTRPHNQG